MTPFYSGVFPCRFPIRQPCSVQLPKMESLASCIPLSVLLTPRCAQQGIAFSSQFIVSSYGHQLGCPTELNWSVISIFFFLTAVTKIYGKSNLREDFWGVGWLFFCFCFGSQFEMLHTIMVVRSCWQQIEAAAQVESAFRKQKDGYWRTTHHKLLK